MQGELWEAVLRRIPAAKHDILIVVTTAGIELMVNKILRLDKDYLLLRARLSGATDAGRIIVLPYDQINNVAFGKILPEADVQAMFGTLAGAEQFADLPACSAAPAGDESSLSALDPDEEAEAEAAESAAPAPPHSPVPVMPSPAPKPSKSVLLAKLRARLGSEHRVP